MLGTVAADLHHMVSGSEGERRRQARVPCTVSVLFQAGEVCGHAQLTDLTPDGVCVRSVLQPEGGSTVRIRFETPEGEKVELTGRVAWSTAAEFGVRIDRNSEAYLSFVESSSS